MDALATTTSEPPRSKSLPLQLPFELPAEAELPAEPMSRVAHDAFAQIIGDSPAICGLKARLQKIANSPSATVLLLGESGTGKDLAARALHHSSDRAGAPFMNITCSALSDQLLESELFGHERGAFTDAKQKKLGLLEWADGGTVFLDEIGEMKPGLQAKLLRFLEERRFKRVGGSTDVSVDVRVIAATNRDLAEQVSRGEFRLDLYYRLMVVPVHLPPLRERREDIAALVSHFLQSQKGASITIDPAALQMLERHDWPGNVRELRNAVEHAMVFAEGGVLRSGDFHSVASPPASGRARGGRFELPEEGLDLAELERDLVIQALERSGGNRTRAAQLLGMNRDQVRYRVAKYGLIG